MYLKWYNRAGMTDISKVLEVFFYRSVSGNEPVREWLKEFSGVICDFLTKP